MKKRRGCVKWTVVGVLSLIALTLFVLCPLAFLYARQLDHARTEYEAPTVYIMEPASGASAPAGSGLFVVAAAMGRIPIIRVELWMGDEVVKTLESESPEGTSPFGAEFVVTLAEGPNLLFVRAVNAAGIVGQSAPLSVFGEPLSPGDVVTQVTVEQGQTLQEIADSCEVDPQTLHQLNPDLGDQAPAPGSTLTVPAPESEEDDKQVTPPSAGPSGPSAPPGSVQVPMPAVPPLAALPVLPGLLTPGAFVPSPGTIVTGTVPVPGTIVSSTVSLPVIIVSLLPKLAIPAFTPPAAPTNLQGYVKDCVVYLRWTDNASDELRYDLWMVPVGGSKRLIASLQPAAGGDAWVTFAAPRTGNLGFWVEAVNLVGKQPSNIRWVHVDASCPTTEPDLLVIEVVDMTTGGAYDRAYCYVSFENRPEVRMPENDSEFIPVSGGRADIAGWSATSRKFALPIPGDGSLEVTGECWGWAGETLNDLGGFSGTYPRGTWDGSRQPLEGRAYEMGLTIQPLGGEPTRVAYSYRDSTIPAPYNLREEKIGSQPNRDHYPKQWEQWFLNRRLRWDWTGSQQLTGFTIFLNGVEYKSVQGAKVRAATITLPALYDRRIRWQVAADSGDAQSPLSQELAYDLPKSQAYAQVKFDNIHWTSTCDGCCCGDCSTCEAYGRLTVKMTQELWSYKQCASKYRPNDVTCGRTYTFAEVCRGSWALQETPDVVILPFDKNATDFTFELRVLIQDDDYPYSPWDTIADYWLYHTFTSLQDAQSELGCGKQFQAQNSSEDGTSTIQYTLTVFPNSCAQAPTVVPWDWSYERPWK